jgi:hypothetical protein
VDERLTAASTTTGSEEALDDAIENELLSDTNHFFD